MEKVVINCITFYLLFQVCAQLSGASVCIFMKNDVEDNEDVKLDGNYSSTIEYSCPGTSDPKHYTECCSNVVVQGCCAQARYFYQIDKTLATTIAISVTSGCVLFTIVIAICCFWSRCPLYSACRVHYTHDIATYVSKSDNIDMDTMPRELSGKKNNKFSPINISNGNLPLGSEMEVV